MTNIENPDVYFNIPRQRSYPTQYSPVVNDAEEIEEMINQIPVPPANEQISEEEEKEIVLKYGAEHVISTFKPVVCCMIIVIISLSFMPYYKIKDSYMLYTPFHEKTNNVGTKIWQSLANSAIVISVVIGVTCLFVLLYKYRCMKIIMGWLVFTSVVLTFLFFGIHFEQIFSSLNLPIDYITACFVIYNYAIVGLLVIHWKGPLKLQQAYLVMNSALFALTLIKYLPDWTTWVLLAFLSVWDLVAVLTPRGPLKALVDMAQERNDYFPSLIYSSTMLWTMVKSDSTVNKNSNKSSKITLNARNKLPSLPDQNGVQATRSSAVVVDTMVSSVNQNNGEPDQAVQTIVISPRRIGDGRNIHLNSELGVGDIPFVEDNVPRPINRWNPENDEDRGIKIGLGDLVFYSVLVGKASMRGDWITTISCFVATLIGLSLTLLLLALFNKPLPALPISISFGLLFYFTTSTIITPYLAAISDQNFFI